MESSCRGCSAIQVSERLGQSSDGGERIAAFAPGVQAALQRADARNALFPEEQRHTGAGGFVWSSTVKNDVAIARQLVILFLQFLSVHAERTGNCLGLCFEIDVMAKVDDDEFFAGVDFLLSVPRR